MSQYKQNHREIIGEKKTVIGNILRKNKRKIIRKHRENNKEITC
jgi:hypothetical protein